MPKVLDFKNTNTDFRLTVSAKTTTHAVMELYGTVGGDWFGEGIIAKDVVEQLKALPASIKTMDLHINSPGGSVTEGMAIYNRLKQYGQKVKITAHIDALAASIASVIMLAADEIVMTDTGFVMIHKPWSYASGNADDFEKTIGVLEDIENQMINLYAKKTKLGRTEIKDMLTKETWMSADTAIESGFIDKKVESLPIAACAVKSAKWLGKHVPKTLTTQDVLATKAVTDLQNKVKDFLARK